MSKIIDAKKNGYQITYTGEKAERFIRPNGEYQQLSYGDGTTTVSSHKADGTKTAQDSMSFDKNTGKILKKTDANGIESSYSYDDGGKDGEQNGWVNEYLVRKIKTEVDYQELDAAGLVKFLKTDKEKEETFTIASIEYNENDDVISETEENGDITSSEYEDEKNPYLPTSETTTNGNDFISQTVYEYDPKGNVISETDKGENKKEETKTVTSYDDHGQPTTVTTTKEGAPDSVEQTTYQDTVQGTTQTTTTTQGEEKETSVIKTDAMGRETENTSKDRKGNILSSTETSYDFMGRAIQTKVTSDGVTQTESKTYDDNGTVATETSASGIKTAYRYDSLNRVIKATESADGTDTVTETSYGYEDAQIHTLNGTKDYQNLSVQTTKANGHVSEKSWTDAAGQTVRSFSHGLYTDHVFTSDGKEIATISLGTKTSGDGKIALQLYDKEGKQTAAIQNPEITKGTSDATVKVGNSSILQKTEYDTKGNETTKTDGNGDQISYAYDDQNRVTEITQGGQKTKVSYQVNSDESTTTSVTDANGHVKQETASASGSVTTTSDLGDGSESITTKYTYDDRGNKISEVYANGAKKTYEYNSRNLVTKTQSYDKEGTKTWIAPQGAEHPTITINLLRDSVKVDFRELTNGTTTYLFDNLDKYNLTDGHEYVYTVSEEIVEGYTSAQNGTDFTNTIEQDNTVEVAGTKTWVDPEGTTLVHPEITIDLLKNGQPTDKKVVLENGTTEYKFENLPKYKVDENGEYVLDNNGNVQLNEYSVRERTVRNYDTFYDGYNITNTFNQDIQGTIEITTTTPSQTSVKTPLDVVFVLDVSESMNDNDNDKKMVNAVNSAITTIMKENPDSRIGVVAYSSKEDSQYSNTENAITLLELGKYTPKTAGKYLTIQENVYYDYYWKEYYDTISTNVNEKNKTTINVYGGTFTQAGIKAGASILTNATTTYTTTVNGKEKTITRTPVMILLSDGDPTYYKTDFKGLTGSRQGSGSDTTENEAYYTIRTADYYKQQITSHYYGTTGTMSKFYTIGLNMSGTLSETILNPTKANLEKCNKEGTEIISHWWGTTTERNVKGKLYDKIKNDGDAGQYSYADKSYPGSMSSEDLQSIFNTIINDNSTSTETRDITLEESNARRVNLEGIDTSKEFKLTIESTTYNFETAQSNGYVKGNDTEGYYVDLTNVKKGTSITISYHK